VNWSGIQVRVRRDVAAPEMPTRFGEQTGADGPRWYRDRNEPWGTVRLALRCARDSIHTAAVEDPVGSRRQPPRPGCRCLPAHRRKNKARKYRLTFPPNPWTIPSRTKHMINFKYIDPSFHARQCVGPERRSLGGSQRVVSVPDISRGGCDSNFKPVALL
jgi:hypothetical protein